MHFKKAKIRNILLANTFSMEAVEKMLSSKIAKRNKEDLHEWNRNHVSNVVYRCLLHCRCDILGFPYWLRAISCCFKISIERHTKIIR